MAVYLHDIPLDVARRRFDQALKDAKLFGVLHTEKIAIDENAIGRVLAEPIWAILSSPHYHASAMDGFALRAEKTSGAMPSSPVTLKMGVEAAYVDTGDPLPDWANAVVPIEQVEPLIDEGIIASDMRRPDGIRIRAALTPWAHVRPMGEDIVASQLVLPAGHVLRPVDLGAIAASGHVEILVSQSPCVGIIPTGSELVAIGTEVRKGDIIDFNSVVLAAQVKAWGGNPRRYPIIMDQFELIRDQVQRAADENDLVMLNAGSSAGSEDFSASVVEALGELLVHGIAVRPGHPVILGMIRRSKESGRDGEVVPIIGVPGYPVSAALTGEIFTKPLLDLWLGRPGEKPVEVVATITRKVTSPSGDDDYLRVVVGRVGEKLLAAPLPRGSGVITSLVKADGICILPRGVQGVEGGAEVKIRLYRNTDELEHTIFAIGSHDMTLDVLAQHLTAKGRRLVSANVGSQGGLVALKRGEAHLAGTHLLDPETGEYNVRFIRQYLPDKPVKLITWVRREQGLLVNKGNPKGIYSLEDLIRPDVRFINRQRGAGTRVLLDYQLKKLELSTGQIYGYEQEEYTHLSVAAAVASGRADCGLAVTAAAQALDLDFVPLFSERYDLAIPCEFLQDDLLTPIFEVINDQYFRKQILQLPGYDISQMGDVILSCG